MNFKIQNHNHFIGSYEGIVCFSKQYPMYLFWLWIQIGYPKRKAKILNQKMDSDAVRKWKTLSLVKDALINFSFR